MVLHEEQGPGDAVVVFFFKAVVACGERDRDDLGRIDAAALDGFLESGVRLDDRADEAEFLIKDGDLAIFRGDIRDGDDRGSGDVDDDILGRAIGQVHEDDAGLAADCIAGLEGKDLVLVGFFEAGVDESRRDLQQASCVEDGPHRVELADSQISQRVVDSICAVSRLQL